MVVDPDFLHRRQLWEAIRKEDTKLLPWSDRHSGHVCLSKDTKIAVPE